MYQLVIEDNFSAAHQLKGYQGACEHLHGHTFKVRVTVTGKELNQIGILIDFKDLKQILKDILDRFDHQNLNELSEFKEINPSSENLARLIYQAIKEALKAEKATLKSVEVFESEKSSATYSED